MLRTGFSFQTKLGFLFSTTSAALSVSVSAAAAAAAILLSVK